jgi:thiamine-phosphate pyrophosphorylase
MSQTLNDISTTPVRPNFPKGLYGITPDWHDIEKLDNAIYAAASGGMQVVQLRLKTVEPSTRLAFAQRLIQTCQRLGVLFILNDDWRMVQTLMGLDATYQGLTSQVNAPGFNRQSLIGAHIGRDDGNSKSVRAALGYNVVLGVSCYDDLDRAIAATQPIEQMGSTVDYVAFGAMFASQTKPGAPSAGLTTLTQARQHWQHQANRPAIVAIGGITLENVAQVVQAGADSIAVSGSLFSNANIEQTARKFSEKIHEYSHTTLNGAPPYD